MEKPVTLANNYISHYRTRRSRQRRLWTWVYAGLAVCVAIAVYGTAHADTYTYEKVPEDRCFQAREQGRLLFSLTNIDRTGNSPYIRLAEHYYMSGGYRYMHTLYVLRKSPNEVGFSCRRLRRKR